MGRITGQRNFFSPGIDSTCSRFQEAQPGMYDGIPRMRPSSPEKIPEMKAGKPRLGCFGCLWQVGLALLLGCVLLLAITGVFYPWAFYLGGHFHLLPYWQGWGKAHAKSGDYVVFVRIEPTSRGSGMYLETNLTGRAYLCTPPGETFRMNLGGGMRKHLNLSTDGEAIGLYMYYWPWNAQFVADHNPSLKFRGHWRNPNLVMDDQGSIAKAFRIDGSVYRGKGGNVGSPAEVVPITFF
jgi:hypothetical protein